MNAIGNNFTNIITPSDIGEFLDYYRGSGVTEVLQTQFIDLYSTDDQQAFSALGNFIDLFITYHKDAALNKEIKDDFMYHEVQTLLEDLSKNPEYSEYADYLLDRANDMKQADLLRNQEAK